MVALLLLDMVECLIMIALMPRSRTELNFTGQVDMSGGLYAKETRTETLAAMQH